jgi:4-amino-4-deoxy-L-arabinose transferase-like glycosyltransferase
MELISLLGGGVAGFVMRFMAAQAEAQARAFDRMITKQKTADESAELARKHDPGSWVRRVIAMTILFAVVVAPFILALLDVPVVVEGEQAWWDIFGLFTSSWETVSGFILLPEVRQGMVALIGFYFGSSQVRR